MHKHRTGEGQSIPFRNERYFCSNGVWYFQTRGGKHKGPFANKAEMEAELSSFINQKKMMNQSFSRSVS